MVACKNTPPQARSTPVPAPPVIYALPTRAVALESDPQAATAWQSAQWSTLAPSLNQKGVSPLTRVACLYDEQYLYVAFVGAAAPKMMTKVSVWLDTSKPQNGTEFFELAADPSIPGDASIRSLTWHRAALPPQPRPDGSPNLAHPVSQIPGCQLTGLRARAGQASVDGSPGWTMVFAIPVKALPAPLRDTPRAGTQWRVNLLREDALLEESSRRETLYANLSPVYPGAQALMPYRMAQLVLQAGTPVAKQ